MGGCSGGPLVGGGRGESTAMVAEGRRDGWRLEDAKVDMVLTTGREDTEAATSSESSEVISWADEQVLLEGSLSIGK